MDTPRSIFLFRFFLPTFIVLTSLFNFCCTIGKKTTVPIRSIQLADAQTQAPRTLLVLLPGRGSKPEHFQRHGFAETLHARGLACEVVAVDAHLKYFLEKKIVDRLRDDILIPARQAGVETIWLVGISLGGLGGLAVTMDYPELVDGLILMSPFMGPESVQDEVRSAGGLLAWQAPHVEDPDEFNVFARDLWRWLRRNHLEDDPVPVVLAYGTREGYLEKGFELLAEAVPASDRVVLEGKHDWKSWQRMWATLVDQGRLDFCR